MDLTPTPPPPRYYSALAYIPDESVGVLRILQVNSQHLRTNISSGAFAASTTASASRTRSMTYMLTVYLSQDFAMSDQAAGMPRENEPQTPNILTTSLTCK